MEGTICQSCGMAIEDASQFGTNANGSANRDYCHYCFVNGAFGVDEAMEDMIECCIQFRVPNPYPDAETARAEMMRYFPSLLRWRK